MKSGMQSFFKLTNKTKRAGVGQRMSRSGAKNEQEWGKYLYVQSCIVVFTPLPKKFFHLSIRFLQVNPEIVTVVP
jgi:hypothetical protein